MDDDSRQLHLWTLFSGSSADCNLLPQGLFSGRITLGRRHLVSLLSSRSSLGLLSFICFFNLRSHSPRCNVSILVTLLQHIICEFHYTSYLCTQSTSVYWCSLGHPCETETRVSVMSLVREWGQYELLELKTSSNWENTGEVNVGIREQDMISQRRLH